MTEKKKPEKRVMMRVCDGCGQEAYQEEFDLDPALDLCMDCADEVERDDAGSILKND